LAFIIGAVLTPGPDVISQIFMSIPLIALYNLSILFAFLFFRRKKQPEMISENSD
jgi:sec-independent protein translocase protein TatC